MSEYLFWPCATRTNIPTWLGQNVCSDRATYIHLVLNVRLVCQIGAHGELYDSLNIQIDNCPLPACIARNFMFCVKDRIYMPTHCDWKKYIDFAQPEWAFWPSAARTGVPSGPIQNIHSECARSEYLFWVSKVRISTLELWGQNRYSDLATT